MSHSTSKMKILGCLSFNNLNIPIKHFQFDYTFTVFDNINNSFITRKNI